MFIRIGIDDGREEMMGMSDLLTKYGMTGVFYIAPFENQCRLRVRDIVELSRLHEVGGHTLTHQRLTRLPLDEARYEIFEGKKELEHLIGKPITKFATPRGWHNDDIIDLIKEAGFTENRNTKMGVVNRDGYDDYHLPCTAHFYPRSEYHGVLPSVKAKFLEAQKEGEKGYFNLLVHTDELKRYDLWGDFEKFLEFIQPVYAHTASTR